MRQYEFAGTIQWKSRLQQSFNSGNGDVQSKTVIRGAMTLRDNDDLITGT